MSDRNRFLLLNLWVLVIGALAWTTPVQAADAIANADEGIVLIARPQLEDALYGSSIVVAKSLPDGSYLGFIINKPLQITLGQVFPDDGPSLKVKDPIYLGGPVGTNLIFALVERHDSPGTGSLQIAPDLFLVINGEVVDRIIASESNHARFFAGMVTWGPGELGEELRRGFWYEMEADAKLVLRTQIPGLWEELVRRSEVKKNTI